MKMTALAVGIFGLLIAALLSIAPEPAPASTTTSPLPASPPGAAQNASLPTLSASPLLLRTRSEQVVFGTILTLAVLPIAALSLRAAAWYWAFLAGPSAGTLLLLAALSHTPNVIQWMVMLGVWVGPLVALRALRRPPPRPSLAGERMATEADLRVHHLMMWPQSAPHISAGTWWHTTTMSWPVTRNSAVQPAVYGLDAGREGRHTLLVVPTGLGKGLWTTTQLLTWNGSAIVNDLKGDTYPLTAGWRATLGPVYVLNVARPTHRFDPTAGAKTEDDLRPLAHAVCDDPADRSYWAQHAERILLVLMLAAKRAREPVFPFVARAIQGGTTRALAMAGEVDPALAERVRPESRQTFASAWETLATRCASLLSPNALATLSGSDFTATDLLREPATLYLQIPEARLADLRPFLRLVWTSLMQQLAAQSDLAGGDHHPLLLILDEAGRTPFAELPDYLVTLRSRRISCAVLVQALSQLRAAYGEQADTILANCSVQVYARSEDLATMEYVSHRIGAAEEILPTVSQTETRHGGSVTRGQLRRFRPILTPQRFRTLEDHQIVAFLPACPPASLARMDWRHHPVLAQRSELLPPELTPVPVRAGSQVQRPAAEYVEPD